MSYARRQTTRTDAAQPAIVDALRKAGVRVEIIGRPVDLLTLYRGRWLPLECKTLTDSGKRRKRKDQEAQDLFIAQTGVPVVRTAEEALRAVGVIGERICQCGIRLGVPGVANF